MRNNVMFAAAILMAAASAGAPVPAHAKSAPQLAYSNFGTGQTFGAGYYFVSGPDYTAFTYAAPFVAGASGNLDYIDLPLQAINQTAGAVVSIFPDDNGVPGTYGNGAALEEWVSTKLPNTPKAVKFVSKHKPALTAGQTYWVIVAPVFYDSVVYWYMNDTNQTGVDATATGGWANGWSPYTANGSVAPALDVWVK